VIYGQFTTRRESFCHSCDLMFAQHLQCRIFANNFLCTWVAVSAEFAHLFVQVFVIAFRDEPYLNILLVT